MEQRGPCDGGRADAAADLVEHGIEGVEAATVERQLELRAGIPGVQVGHRDANQSQAPAVDRVPRRDEQRPDGGENRPRRRGRPRQRL
jgi:hypothetical protein